MKRKRNKRSTPQADQSTATSTAAEEHQHTHGAPLNQADLFQMQNSMGMATVSQWIRGQPENEAETPGEEVGELDRIIDDETFETGLVTHEPAQEADEAIQDSLGAHLVDAILAGRQITGQVAVVGDAEWDAAGENQYGRSRWHSPRGSSSRLYRDSINGFVDREDRVWIHKDRGNSGTMIHEAIHKYSDPTLIGISQPLNEGVTEYFARFVCTNSDINIAHRGNYQSNFEVVEQMAALFGFDLVAAAYFSGQTSGLSAAFNAWTTQTTWRQFIALTKENDWAAAWQVLMNQQ